MPKLKRDDPALERMERALRTALGTPPEKSRRKARAPRATKAKK